MDHTNWTQFWLDRWQQGIIHFHQNDFEALLSQFPSVQGKKIFVPLCGKTKDMLYFAQMGSQVIGVELSQIACESFFVENGLEFEVSQSDKFTVYQGKQVTIYCGDFFKVPQDFLKGVSVVYDRAALIALPHDLRLRYADQITRLLGAEKANPASPARIYLIALEYQSNTPDRPPFSVNQKEVEALYSSHFQVDRLISENDDSYSPHLESRDTTLAVESAYLLTLKPAQK